MTNVPNTVRHFSFLFIFLFSFFISEAQVFDSISCSFRRRPSLTGGFATKSTFINGFRSPIFTARAGLDFNHSVRIGAGVSWLKLSPYKTGSDNTPFYLDKPIIDSTGTYMAHPALNFLYVNVFFEYIYFSSLKWQFSVPLQLGAGNSKYTYNFNGENITEKRHWVLLYEPAVSGQYRIIKWFGVGLDVGMRLMIVTNKSIGTKFNSPMYDIKAIIYWGELYRTIRGKKEKRL
jgi:hypothetical protein